MKELIPGQLIRIDNHRRGAGGIDYYNDPANDIHLDKTVYDGRKKNGTYHIRVPLNSDRPITINQDEKLHLPRRIKKEIQHALDDKRKRKRFIAGLRKVLEQYPLRGDDYNEGDNNDRIYDAIRRIADCFDLGWNDELVEKYVRQTQAHGTRFIALLPQPDFMCYIAIEFKQVVVADYNNIGHRYVREWRRLR